jgi:uncharacterized protein YmfQ (DUF2313 family)
MTSDDYLDLLMALLPPCVYDHQAKTLRAELRAEANALAATERKAKDVLNAVTPFNAPAALLADYERLYQLGVTSGMTLQARRQQVLAAMNATGGLSRAYFINLAKSLGYDITISEPEPFRAGIGRAGDRIWTPDIIWVWIVNISDQQVPVYHFRAGSSLAGERLTTYGQNLLENLFNDLKPAHTQVVFNYDETA